MVTILVAVMHFTSETKKRQGFNKPLLNKSSTLDPVIQLFVGIFRGLFWSSLLDIVVLYLMLAIDPEWT